MANKPEPRSPVEVAYGEAFQRARNNAGLNLIDTAGALGVSINRIRWHEAGARIMPPAVLLKAAKLFSVRPAALGADYRAQQAIVELETALAEAGVRFTPVRLSIELIKPEELQL